MITEIARGTRKTRKVHRCYECYRPIPKGTEAEFFTGKYDDVYTLYFHTDCSAASAHYWKTAGLSVWDFDGEGYPPLIDDINESGVAQHILDSLRGQFPHAVCRMEWWHQKSEQKFGEWECPQ